MKQSGCHGLAGLLLLLAGCGGTVESDGRRPGSTAAATSAPEAITADVPAATATAREPTSRSDVICADGVGEDIDHEPLPCPSEMAHIGHYCIDRWEGHLVTRDGAGRPTIHPHYERPADGVRYQARSAPGMFPQAHISRVESESACEASGKRLCTWLEWRRACQGGRWSRFPYGNSLLPGACNHLKDHLLPRLHGHDPMRWKQEHFDDPRLNQDPDFLERTGARPRCISPDGPRDQVGNLHEWVSDSVTLSFMKRLAEESVPRDKQPWRPGNGMFLGGFYSTRAEHGPGCHYTTVAHGPSYHDYSTGFRCCRDADRSGD